MDDQVEFSITGEYKVTSELQESLSVISHKETNFYPAPTEIQSVGTVSYNTSTPNFTHRKECLDYEHGDDGSNISEKSARIRREECHRVHHTSELDDSNLTSYEKAKRKKRRRMSLMQSLSCNKELDSEEVDVDTLENHLFPDMSFSASELSYIESKFNTTGDTDLSWIKLQGVSYSSKYDFSGDELDTIQAVNHPQRSEFRQKRRDWYLNRRNIVGRSHTTMISTSLWQRYIRQLFHILFVITFHVHRVSRKLSRHIYWICHGVARKTLTFIRYIFLPLVLLGHLFLFIYSLMKSMISVIYSKILNLFISSRGIEEVAVAEDTSFVKERSRYRHRICLIFILFPILLALLVGYYENNKFNDIIAPVPNPLESGITNAYSLYIDKENSRIPAWHVYPNLSGGHPSKKSLHDMSPIIMYLRETGAPDSPELLNVYQTLSSLGYHVIVPTDLISQTEILKTWRWIKSQSNASVYMWGYGISAALLTANAKLFCKDLIPPNGVIIAREKKTGTIKQSMEIWSCNCALNSSAVSNGTDFKYNHVKCPIDFNNNDANDVYSQVVACIETVNKNVTK